MDPEPHTSPPESSPSSGRRGPHTRPPDPSPVTVSRPPESSPSRGRCPRSGRRGPHSRPPQSPQRLRILVQGLVQGVGFRPTVVRIARALQLTGFVQNDPHAVIIEAQGHHPHTLVQRLHSLPPPIRVHHITTRSIPPSNSTTFTIRPSSSGPTARPLVPPDLATCPECWSEWRGTGRRAGYALLSCTHCGPRSSIVHALPLDRPHTALAAFPLCDACQAEVDCPADRRFHAQVTACPDCGPRVTGLAEAIPVLKAGGIVALKGLSGFQLLCDAQNHAAVDRLRHLKQRPHKPLAVLVDAPITPACPVVVGPTTPALAHLAPGLPWLGRLAPATPLHRVLLDACGPLVCTSANRSGDAIACTPAELPHVDAIIDHSRPILRSADDSVVRRGATSILLRRGRGLHTPLPISQGPTVLALGAHQKATLCLALADHAIVTPYLGTLSRRSVIDRYDAELQRLLHLYGAQPVALACDRHPDYHSSQVALQLARTLGVPLHRIPHHEAHIAAVLAEHQHVGPALGFAWDGTGLGDDGLLRGSEALHWDGTHFTRVASLAPFSIPGDGARSPRRCAEGWRDSPRWGTPTTSMGRLFDAAAWCCGYTADTTYEAAAAMQLEAIARPGQDPWPLPLLDGRWQHQHLIAHLLDTSVPAEVRAGRFHATLVQAIVDLSENTHTVVLSGGCFQNARLVHDTIEALQARGHRVLFPRALPPNDEAISFGQAWLTRARLQPCA